ncbi:MAG: GNAT family N-acetyltransferase [Defluviitaleaceae bacterium]|nr:GNAT family N-acetyltransferase [Defluviitaleaceae bacterium]
MDLIKLDLQNDIMIKALLPLYQTYEAEISEEELLELFPPDTPLNDMLAEMHGYFEGKPVYICVVDGAYKGFVSYHMDTKDTPGFADGYEGWGHLSDIFIDKDSRKQGMGKMLVEKAEEGLGKLGIKGIYLTDIVGNDKFWVSLGYVDTGKIEPDEGGRIYEKI